MSLPSITTPSESSNLSLKAECRCKRFSATYSIPISALPLKSAICHCTSCRHATGSLFITTAVIPNSASLVSQSNSIVLDGLGKRPFTARLTAYHSSPTLTRYFCATCGASICNFEDAEWEFCTGILSTLTYDDGIATTVPILDRVQLFIADTLDGGCALWLFGYPARHAQHRTSATLTRAAIEDMSTSVSAEISATAPHITASTIQPLRCHCGAVNLQLRANGYDGDPQYNPVELWEGRLCACKSCRLTSGLEISSWISTIYYNLKTAGTDDSVDPWTAPLTTYTCHPGSQGYEDGSNEGTALEPWWRSFCSICGAKVFCFAIREKNFDDDSAINVAAGLLEGATGARAEEWVDWKLGISPGQVDHSEDALDEEFVRGLERGFKRWHDRDHEEVVEPGPEEVD